MLALARSNPLVDFLGEGTLNSGLGVALKTGIFLRDASVGFLVRLLVLKANSYTLVFPAVPFLGVFTTSSVSLILALFVGCVMLNSQILVSRALRLTLSSSVSPFSIFSL